MCEDEEIEIRSPLHLRFSIDNWQNVGPGYNYRKTSSASFQFNGGKYNFNYCYVESNEAEGRLQIHAVELSKEFGGNCRYPIDVSVRVESGGRGRIVPGLSEREHFDNVCKGWTLYFWRKEEHELQRAIPDFRNHKMTWIVVLSWGPSIPRAVKVASSSQTNCSIPEGFEMSCMESLSADFARLMVRGSDPDTVFVCADHSFEAHSLIVCGRAPVIAAMLGSDMVEGSTGVIAIPNAELEVFEHFLRYLYCGKLDRLTPDLAMALYELGDQYAVFGLVKRCSRFLLEHLRPDNACDVLVVADLHSDEDFARKIIAYMAEAAVDHASDRCSALRENYPKLAARVLRGQELAQEKKRRRGKRKFCFSLQFPRF